jgi:hypothetical protein
MTRALLVGLAGALITVLLVTSATYVELRYTELGAFMRDSAVEMRNDHVSRGYTNRYGDPIDFLGRWLRLNQLVVQPALCIIVGIFIGLLSRRVLVSTLIGVAPVAAFELAKPDMLAALSVAMCATVCWSIAVGTHLALARRSQSSPLPA